MVVPLWRRNSYPIFLLMFMKSIFCPSQRRVPARVVSLICAGSLVSLTACQPDPVQAPAQTQTSATVEVLTMQAQSLPRVISLPARVSPLRLAEVRPQVSGILARQYFQEGKLVEAGELLYQIQDDSYRIKLEQSQAELAVEKASLLSVESQAQRAQRLWDARMITQQEFDLAQASLKQALARIAAREAQLKATRLDLQRTQIRAPIRGRIGRSLVSEGSLLAADQSAALARIQQIDQVYVDIQQASHLYLKLQQQKNQAGRVGLKLEHGHTYQHTGQLVFADTQVDSDSSALLLRARFVNPQQQLLPGMSVHAEIEFADPTPAFLVPQTAVQYNARNQAFVWVLKAKQVQQQLITLDQTQAEHWVVRQGLQAGDQVVTAGFARLQEQQTVSVKASPKASAEARQAAGAGA